MESADWFRTKVDRLYLAVYQTPVPLLGGGTLGGEFLSVVGCWQEDPNPSALTMVPGSRCGSSPIPLPLNQRRYLHQFPLTGGTGGPGSCKVLLGSRDLLQWVRSNPKEFVLGPSAKLIEASFFSGCSCGWGLFGPMLTPVFGKLARDVTRRFSVPEVEQGVEWTKGQVGRVQRALGKVLGFLTRVQEVAKDLEGEPAVAQGLAVLRWMTLAYNLKACASLALEEAPAALSGARSRENLAHFVRGFSIAHAKAKKALSPEQARAYGLLLDAGDFRGASALLGPNLALAFNRDTKETFQQGWFDRQDFFILMEKLQQALDEAVTEAPGL